MAAKTAAPAKAPSEALQIEIAAKHFHLETLETPNRRACTRLDFYDARSGRSAPRWRPPSPLAKPQPAEQETTP